MLTAFNYRNDICRILITEPGKRSFKQSQTGGKVLSEVRWDPFSPHLPPAIGRLALAAESRIGVLGSILAPLGTGAPRERTEKGCTFR